MNVNVSAIVTLKVQSKTIELSMDEAKELYKELGKIVEPSTPSLSSYSPPLYKNPLYTVSTSEYISK